MTNYTSNTSEIYRPGSYFSRLAYRHPAPLDFYKAIGRDLTKSIRKQGSPFLRLLVSVLMLATILLHPFTRTQTYPSKILRGSNSTTTSSFLGMSDAPYSPSEAVPQLAQSSELLDKSQNNQLSGLDTPTSAPLTFTVDMFRNKAAWQDDECFGGCSNPATHAVDGNNATYWASRSDGAWRVIMSSSPNQNCPDCIPAVPIKRIRFYQDSAGGKYATKIDISASVRASYFGFNIWEMVHPVSVITNVTVTSGWNEINLPGNAEYRMYKIAATAFQGTGTWLVYTVEGFSGEPVPPPPAGDLFYGSVGAWDDNECVGGCSYPASSAIDGSEGTEWHARSDAWRVLAAQTANTNCPECITPVAITKIRFFNGGNYATSVNINASYEVSYFGLNIWEMVDPVTVMSSVTVGYGWNEITLPGDPYRMYQIEATAHNGTGTWSMHTVQGFGNNIPWDSEGYGGCSCDTREHVGSPVDTTTGNFWHTFTDLYTPGRGFPLNFSHTYNAALSNTTDNTTLGYGWTHSYNWYIDQDDDDNYLVHRGNGGVLPFNPDLSAPLRVQATLTETGGVFVLTTTHGLDTYVFHSLDNSDEAGKLISMTDRNGYTTSLSYNGNGLLEMVTDPAGRTIIFSYGEEKDDYGLLLSVTDSSGRSFSFRYENGEMTGFYDVGGKFTSFTYEEVSGYHRLLTMTNPNGGVLTNVYDTSNRVTTQTDPLSRTINYGYYDLGNGSTTTRITDTLGLVTVHYYADNMLTRVVRNPGDHQAVTTRSYQYGTTWPSAVTDPNGHITRSTWDNQGNPLTVTDQLNRTTLYKYNLTNDLTTITATNNLTTAFGYDSRGNVTTITRPVTETNQLITTTLTYDPIYHGDVLTVTDPLTHGVGIQYNNYGYPITTTNQVGATSAFTYNSVGWLLNNTDPMGHTITATYNIYGAPLIVTNTLGYTTTYGYDANRNLVTVQDANHRAITNTYNLGNEVTRFTRPDGTHSDYGYDGLGRLITQTNALGQSTLYGFDDINRRVVVTDALGRSSSAAYDLAGVTTIITDARGVTTTLGYDAAYQLRSITYHDGTPYVAFDYNSLGMRTVMTEGTGLGSASYAYDSLNRLKSVQDGNGDAVSYAYDNASRLTSLTYPYNGVSTRTVTRGYDAANRLTSVEDWSSNVSQFSYNADGLLTGITYPNDTTAAIGYNAADQLTSITHSSGGTPFLSLSYTRDPVGVLSIANEGGRGSHGYEYDALYRLTGDGLGTGTTISNTWGYDAATQIVQTSYQVGAGTPITTVRTYDAANQLVSLSEKEGSTSLKKITFTFDDNGNRTRQYDSVPKQPTNYVYDAANRLIEFNQDDDGISYTVYNYNGDGLRVAKNNCAGPCYYTGYIWDVGVEAGLPLLLQDGEASYIYGPGGMILEEVTGGKEYYYHHDQLGSVRSLTDSSGSEVDTYDYDAYGNKLASSTSSTYNPFGYTGEYTDSESGMLYLRARYYDPATQQFLTKDSLVAWTEQAYAYVAGSPTYFTDPSGHCPMCIVVVPPVAGAAVAVAEGILFVGTAITTGLLGALGLNMLGNGSGSSCAINYTYSTPLVDPYPVDSSGNVLIGASTPAGSNTIGIRSPLELIPTTVYAEIDVDIEDPGATLGPAGLVENPNRTGSWGKYDGENGKFRERWRVDYGDEAKPGWRGKDHVHHYGGKEHLDPSTPFDPDAPFPP